WFAWFAVYQVDDAFIVYRYAGNLARGMGFVFNPGERVEGVSCFLWTLFLTPFAAAGLPLPLVAPVLTLLTGLATLVLVPGLSARLDGRASPAPRDLAAALLLAAHPAFAAWSAGALETVPYALLLVLALRDHPGGTGGKGFRSAVWMGLATLLRPEAPFPAAALACDRWLRGRAGGLSPATRIRDLLAWGGVVLAFFLPFLLFRFLYFGAWLPNTWHAKTGAGPVTTIQEGARYVMEFAAGLAPGFGATGRPAAAAGALLIVALLAWALPRERPRPAALMTASILLAVVLEGGDWMILHRFLVPALPFLFCVLAGAAGRMMDRAPRLRAPAAAAGLLLLASFITAGVRARDGANGLKINAAGYRLAHDEVARFLAAGAAPGDRVALMDIGRIGYATGLPIFDISGLTEPGVARAPGGFLEKEYPAAGVLGRRPRYIVLVNGFAIDDRIAADPEFRRRYRPVFERNHRFNWTPPGDYRLTVYERRDPSPGDPLGPVDQ
ncbi:MAG: hypothetical protein ACRD6R_13730, partial [Candidatus Polarisedimenticolia bacterium]